MIADELELAWSEWDEAAKTLLARIDGAANVQTILATAALPQRESLELLGQMAVTGIIAFR